MTAVYNEFDAYAARWLGRLATAGHIASGTVDARSIREVQPDDVRDATQFHAFAGIGVWSHALRLAEWPDDRPVWTGSCPCQPFSVAGRRKGYDDERHLWPEWRRLIAECLPPVVFGEQVASSDGRAWLDAVRTDLEALGYAVGAADLCAAGVGAPHIRQRLYFGAVRLADADATVCVQLGEARLHGRRSSEISRHPPQSGADWTQRDDADGCGTSSGLGDTGNAGLEGHAGDGDDGGEPRRDGAQPRGPTPTSGFWSAVAWLPCRDNKWRPVEPGTFPLAHGAPARVGRLRAYGNAIVSEVAATFVRAFAESLEKATKG